MAGGQDANGGDGVGGGAGPKPKPSDFYPNNVKRVPGGANPGRNASNVKIDVHSKPPQEPTSPLSPPTGPIPMGFVPPQQVKSLKSVKTAHTKGHHPLVSQSVFK